MSPSSNDENEERSRRFLFSSLWNRAGNIMDDQRMERLQQCRRLENQLSNCRKYHEMQQQTFNSNAKNEKASVQNQELNLSSSGLNSNSTSFWKYFSWKTPTSVDTPQCQDSPNDEQQQRQQRQISPASKPPPPRLEDSKEGIRMVRFFDWRNYDPRGERHPRDGSYAVQHEAAVLPATYNPCLREEHSVWACRAVVLSCGKELTALRDCFKQTPGGPHAVLRDCPPPFTTYESSSQSPEAQSIPCHAEQLMVGKCVAEQARQLHERMQARKEAS